MVGLRVGPEQFADQIGEVPTASSIEDPLAGRTQVERSTDSSTGEAQLWARGAWSLG